MVHQLKKMSGLENLDESFTSDIEEESLLGDGNEASDDSNAIALFSCGNSNGGQNSMRSFIGNFSETTYELCQNLKEMQEEKSNAHFPESISSKDSTNRTPSKYKSQKEKKELKQSKQNYANMFEFEKAGTSCHFLSQEEQK